MGQFPDYHANVQVCRDINLIVAGVVYKIESLVHHTHMFGWDDAAHYCDIRLRNDHFDKFSQWYFLKSSHGDFCRLVNVGGCSHAFGWDYAKHYTAVKVRDMREHDCYSRWYINPYKDGSFLITNKAVNTHMFVWDDDNDYKYVKVRSGLEVDRFSGWLMTPRNVHIETSSSNIHHVFDKNPLWIESYNDPTLSVESKFTNKTDVLTTKEYTYKIVDTYEKTWTFEHSNTTKVFWHVNAKAGTGFAPAANVGGFGFDISIEAGGGNEHIEFNRDETKTTHRRVTEITQTDTYQMPPHSAISIKKTVLVQKSAEIEFTMDAIFRVKADRVKLDNTVVNEYLD